MTAAQNAAASIVATWEYEDERFGELRSPSHDADRLAQLLADRLGGFDVEVLRNQGVLKVKRRIETFCASGRATISPFSTSATACSTSATATSSPPSTRTWTPSPSTGIDRDFVNARIEDCAAGALLLLLDTCHSGAFGKDAGFKAATRPPRAGAGFGGEGAS